MTQQPRALTIEDVQLETRFHTIDDVGDVSTYVVDGFWKETVNHYEQCDRSEATLISGRGVAGCLLPVEEFLVCAIVTLPNGIQLRGTNPEEGWRMFNPPPVFDFSAPCAVTDRLQEHYDRFMADLAAGVYDGEKFKYVKIPLDRAQRYHMTAYRDELELSSFTAEYISVDEYHVSYYGFDTRYKHPVIVNYHDIFLTIEDAATAFAERVAQRKAERKAKVGAILAKVFPEQS